MTTKLTLKQHLRAAINILLPFSEYDRGYMAFIVVLSALGVGVATIVTRSAQTAIDILGTMSWFAGMYAVFHAFALLNILLLLRLGPASFRKNFAGFWRTFAERKLALEGFWRRRRRRRELKAAGYNRELRHYLASVSEPE